MENFWKLIKKCFKAEADISFRAGFRMSLWVFLDTHKKYLFVDLIFTFLEVK